MRSCLNLKGTTSAYVASGSSRRSAAFDARDKGRCDVVSTASRQDATADLKRSLLSLRSLCHGGSCTNASPTSQAVAVRCFTAGNGTRHQPKGAARSLQYRPFNPNTNTNTLITARQSVSVAIASCTLPACTMAIDPNQQSSRQLEQLSLRRLV